MLPRERRLRSSSDFAAAVRGGSRSGSSTVVMHLGTTAAPGPARVGFIVSKAVGNAVVRNRVKRRLRHLARERLSVLPGSAVLVVRALPSAAAAGWADLESDFDRALDRVVSS